MKRISYRAIREPLAIPNALYAPRSERLMNLKKLDELSELYACAGGPSEEPGSIWTRLSSYSRVHRSFISAGLAFAPTTYHDWVAVDRKPGVDVQ